MKVYLPLLILLFVSWTHANAADPKKQQQLQRDIRELSKELSSQQGESRDLQSEVTKLEKKLGEISDKHHQTEKKIDATLSKLEDSVRKQQKLDAELQAQKSGLAQQLQALYTAGEQSHLRLLLRQDEPSDISRTVRYFEYLNENRVTRIQGIQKTLNDIEAVRTAIEKDNSYLQELNKTLEQQKVDIQGTLKARSFALDNIKGDIRSAEKKLSKLKTEEANLQAVLDRIAANKAKEKQQTSATTATEEQQTAKPSSTEATTKPAKTTKAEAVTNTSSATLNSGKAFSKLRGQLPWPVSGKIIHSYGSARNEKQRWRGVVLAAPGGSKVKAIAKGRVAFSGWMDGYGHLIIIEHDNNYMSLYGYNRAVYKKEGATVNANETIAAVGNSSGQSQDALYFEIRSGTTPQNPARWCR
ncbi:murein hydrolase activator EnvC family protein [Thiothrix winogradskyi]|uniref:Peptidoglycan DD-metalloendopeptidase family protein n=1 Tax=Thiothrix winogradskyi TaxID=96472 RepID=A0ABY3T3L5_9GAMM|nr:peptidoglycan DD-metalloendopeptidase family protein [Thiothrix winogradskyi]UJS25374.1 peptidoglycan DD-metalloendopeptidase family protein [Thiothrix winogradskyi]